MAKYTESDIHDICADYEVAFEQANPGLSVYVFKTGPGWYRMVQAGGITGARNSYRLSQIERMTVLLKERIAKADVVQTA